MPLPKHPHTLWPPYSCYWMSWTLSVILWTTLLSFVQALQLSTRFMSWSSMTGLSVCFHHLHSFCSFIIQCTMHPVHRFTHSSQWIKRVYFSKNVCSRCLWKIGRRPCWGDWMFIFVYHVWWYAAVLPYVCGFKRPVYVCLVDHPSGLTQWLTHLWSMSWLQNVFYWREVRDAVVYGYRLIEIQFSLYIDY